MPCIWKNVLGDILLQQQTFAASDPVHSLHIACNKHYVLTVVRVVQHIAKKLSGEFLKLPSLDEKFTASRVSE